VPYCNLVEIKKQLPEAVIVQLTDDTLIGAVVVENVDKAIADADAEIDGYCRKKYDVPFTPVPSIINKLAVDISIYNLFSRRDSEPPKVRTDRYNAAVRVLENIAKGTVTIGAGEDTATQAPADLPQFSTPDPVFTKDSLKGF
jgi:phage gp36-like protein